MFKVDLDDGVYLDFICVKNKVAYPSGRMSLGDLSKDLTEALIDGLQKSVCDTIENNLKAEEKKQK